MLSGEYSVLGGGRSLAFTVDKRLQVSVETQALGVSVHSELWSEAKNLHLTDTAPENPLLNSVHWAMKNWGIDCCRVEVRSHINVSDGLGSSSAVRLASLAALSRYAGRDDQLWDLARLAWQQQKLQQGFASGYDIASQTCGGLVLFEPDYNNWPGQCQDLGWKRLESIVHVFVGGKGAPTDLVAGSTSQWLKDQGRWDSLNQYADILIDELVAYNDGAANYNSVIEAVANHRRVFEDNLNFPIHIKNDLSSVSGFDKTWSFKTTGAGGEDSILLFGSENEIKDGVKKLKNLGWEKLNTSVSPQGLEIIEG